MSSPSAPWQTAIVGASTAEISAIAAKLGAAARASHAAPGPSLFTKHSAPWSASVPTAPSSSSNYRQIDYRQNRGLRAPPRGYRYVQSGNDAVLVAITSGIIGAVFANMIR